MKSPNQKLKLLYLAQILQERTDENHVLTVPDMIAALAEYDIAAERKSIYDDLECLRVFGLDICAVKSKSTGYYIASRDFELPELKLLVDSVQASKFITHKKSLELIEKLESLAGRPGAKQLHRQVFVTNRVKTLNEQIYYNVDKIHEAIAANKQITFRYFDLDVHKQKVYRKDGEFYVESPVALTWDDENYYMIAYKEKYNSYTHYRVDKMEHISLADTLRILPEAPFDLTAYTKKMFQMFSGEETEVRVRFDNTLVGVVFDRFGTDIPVIPDGENHFVCHLKVAVSPNFLSWIFSFGNRAKLLGPASVQEAFCALLRESGGQYE